MSNGIADLNPDISIQELEDYKQKFIDYTTPKQEGVTPVFEEGITRNPFNVSLFEKPARMFTESPLASVIFKDVNQFEGQGLSRAEELSSPDFDYRSF